MRGLPSNPAFQQIPQIGKLPLIQNALEAFSEAMRVGDAEQCQRIMSDLEGKLARQLRNPETGEFFYWEDYTKDGITHTAVIQKLKKLAEQQADEENEVPLHLRTPQGRAQHFSDKSKQDKYNARAGLIFADLRHRIINQVIDANGLLGGARDAISVEGATPNTTGEGTPV
jgi:hypothetical protein